MSADPTNTRDDRQRRSGAHLRGEARGRRRDVRPRRPDRRPGRARGRDDARRVDLGGRGARAARISPPRTGLPNGPPRRAPPGRGGRGRAGGGGHDGRGRRARPPATAPWAPTGRPLGPIEVHTESFESAMKKRGCCRLPIVRGVVALVRVAEDRHEGARHLRQRPARRSPTRRSPARPGASRSSCRWCSRSACSSCCRSPSRTSGRTSSAARSCFVVVEKLIRISIFLGYLWAHLPRQGPAARVRVPRRRAQGDRLLRGRRAARRPRTRRRYSRLHVRCGTSFLLIVMIIARVRVRPDRAARPALADPVAHRRASRSSPGSPTR